MDNSSNRTASTVGQPATFVLSPEALEAVDRIAATRGVSRTRAILYALSDEVFFIDAAVSKKRILIHSMGRYQDVDILTPR